MNEAKPSVKDPARSGQPLRGTSQSAAAQVPWNDPSQRVPLITLVC